MFFQREKKRNEEEGQDTPVTEGVGKGWRLKQWNGEGSYPFVIHFTLGSCRLFSSL